MDMMTAPLLQIQNLAVTFGQTTAVHSASLTVHKGQTVALVGESGSGKSVTALSVMGLLPYPHAAHPKGRVIFDGQDILGAPDKIMRTLRGRRIGMIFQEPMTSLNPLHTIEKQLGEVLKIHQGMNAQQTRARVLELLDLVGLPQMKDRLNAYPHELSGGQRQRVMIAMAQPRPFDRGRTDHRAGCDGAGADTGTAQKPQRQIGHGAVAHHP